MTICEGVDMAGHLFVPHPVGVLVDEERGGAPRHFSSTGVSVAGLCTGLELLSDRRFDVF